MSKKTLNPLIAISFGGLLVGCHSSPKPTALAPSAKRSLEGIQVKAVQFLKDLEGASLEQDRALLRKNPSMALYLEEGPVGTDPRLARRQQKRFLQIIQAKQQGRPVPSDAGS